MTIVLAGLALLLGAAGVLASTRATLGVALIAFACLLAICARLIQASAQHWETRSAAKSAPVAPTPRAEPLPDAPLTTVQTREPGLG